MKKSPLGGRKSASHQALRLKLLAVGHGLVRARLSGLLDDLQGLEECHEEPVRLVLDALSAPVFVGFRGMLSRSEFFHGSSECFLQDLSCMLEVELFRPGQEIMKQGQEGDKMYFLNWGQVQVLLGEQVVGDIGCGSVFGEMALFGNGRRSCTVRASDTCDCRSVDQHRFQRLLNCYPEERERFEKLVEGRLQATTRLKQDLRKLKEPEERPDGRLRWRRGL